MTILATVLGVIGAGLFMLGAGRELKFIAEDAREEASGTFLWFGATFMLASVFIFLFLTGKPLP